MTNIQGGCVYKYTLTMRIFEFGIDIAFILIDQFGAVKNKIDIATKSKLTDILFLNYISILRSFVH